MCSKLNQLDIFSKATISLSLALWLVHVLVCQVERCVWTSNREVLCIFHRWPKHAHVGDLWGSASHWTAEAVDGPRRLVRQDSDRWELSAYFMFSLLLFPGIFLCKHLNLLASFCINCLVVPSEDILTTLIVHVPTLKFVFYFNILDQKWSVLFLLLHRDFQATSGYQFCLCHGTPRWRAKPDNSAPHTPLQLLVVYWTGWCQQEKHFFYHSRKLDG